MCGILLNKTGENMITKIDHIGIAVKSLNEAVSSYEKMLGIKCHATEEISSQKVRVAILKIGEVNIELLEPTSPESPIAKHLEKRGEGVHHIAYTTDNVEGQLLEAKTAGCTLINETPIRGAGSKQIAFLHPKSTCGVLLELAEHDGEVQ